MGLLIHHSSKAPLAQQPTILRGLRVPSSNYGDVVPIVFGQNRVPGKLLDYQDFTAIANTSTTAAGGKGLGGGQHEQKTTSYTYKAAVAILLCQKAIQGLYNVWDTKGKLAQQSVTETYTVPGGGGTYTVGNSANYYDDYGVGRSDAYSVSANDYGDIPRTYSGTYRTRMAPVGSSPAVGQYSKPAPGQYHFAAGDAGTTVNITYTYTVPDSSSNGQATQILTLTLFKGTAGQSPWAYMTSNHPGRDLGYSNLAYVASSAMDLGSSGSLPNYTYEVIGLNAFGAGITDANPSDIINAILTDSIIGVGFPSANVASLSQFSNYCIANGLFVSPVYNSQRPANQLIQDLLDATNSNAYWSEGLLKIVPYGDTTVVGNGATYTPTTTPIYDFTDDDFLAPADQDPILITRDPYQDAYNHVQIEWCNRSNSYNPEVMDEKDDGAIAMYGHRPKGSVQYDFITTSAVAQFVANTQLKREVYIRKTYKFTVPWRYCLVEPMDLVTLTDARIGLNKTPVRVTEVDEDADGNIKIVAEEFPWGTATATAYPKQAPSSYNPQADADPGQVNAPVMYEPTARATSYNGYEIWLAVSGQNPANWGGCFVYVSRDNARYQRFGQIDGPARMGVLTATLANTADPDTTDTLAVDLSSSGGTLAGGSAADCDNFVTLCLVGNELVSYQAATLTSANHYNLGTRLRRGVYGSTIASHAGGATFVRLDEAIFKFNYDPQWIGQTIYFKFVSFNTLGGKVQSLANVTAYSYTISGIKGAVDNATGVFLPGLDSVADGSTYIRMPAANMDAARRGLIDFSQGGHVSKNVDNIADGATYGRPLGARLNAGKPWIDFSEAIHSNKNIDNVADGSTYGRPLGARLNAGKPWIDFSEGIHSNKNIDNVADGSTYGRPLGARLNAGKPWIDFSEGIHSNKNIDNVADGSTYGRPLNAALTAGAVDMAKSGVVGKAIELVRNPDFESGDRDWNKQTGWSIVNNGNAYGGSYAAQWIGSSGVAALTNAIFIACQPGDVILAQCMIKVTAGGGNGYVRVSFWDASQTTELADIAGNSITSSTYLNSRVVATAPASSKFARVECVAQFVTSATTLYADQFNASIQLKSLDEMPDGSTYARPLSSRINAGRPTVDFSEGIHANKHLDNVGDGVTYYRMPAGNMDTNRRGLVDFSQAGHLSKNLDNVADGTRAAWDSGTQKNAAVDSSGNLKLKNKVIATASTSGPTTSSATFSDLAEMTITVTTNGNKVLILFSGCFYNGLGDNQGVQLRLLRDGSAIGQPVQHDWVFVSGGITRQASIPLLYIDAPSAASHTYKIQWLSTGADQIVANDVWRFLEVVELG